MPLEQLCHTAVLSRLGQAPLGDQKDAEIPLLKFPLELLLQNAVANALVTDILQKLLQREPISVVLRRKQTGVGAHPVLGQEKLRLGLHGLPAPLQRLLISESGPFL